LWSENPQSFVVTGRDDDGFLEATLVYPCHGALRVEQRLRLKGLQVSAGGLAAPWSADQARAVAGAGEGEPGASSSSSEQD